MVFNGVTARVELAAIQADINAFIAGARDNSHCQQKMVIKLYALGWLLVDVGRP